MCPQIEKKEKKKNNLQGLAGISPGCSFSELTGKREFIPDQKKDERFNSKGRDLY